MSVAIEENCCLGTLFGAQLLCTVSSPCSEVLAWGPTIIFVTLLGGILSPRDGCNQHSWATLHILQQDTLNETSNKS
jgi:hypothetical protein